MGGADEKGRLIVAQLDTGNGWGHNTPCRERCKNWVDGACLCQSCQYCHFKPSKSQQTSRRASGQEMFSILTRYFGETCTHFSFKDDRPDKCWTNMRCGLYELEYKSSGQKYKIRNWIE